LNSSYDSLVAKWQQWAGEGLRLADIDIVQVGNERRYNGVWVAGTDGYGLWANANWTNFKRKWDEWSGQNLRLIDLEVTDPANTVNAPTPTQSLMAMGMGVATDENGGEGYGGIFGAVSDAINGADVNTGFRSGANESAPMMPAAQSVAGEGGSGGFGGMQPALPTLVMATSVGSGADSTDGFGGLGASVSSGTGADDGFGGIGGDGHAGDRSTDLDTGGIGGM